MSSISINYVVECSCGKKLKANGYVVNSILQIEVDPCDKCYSRKYDSGYREGYGNGYKDRENNEEYDDTM